MIKFNTLLRVVYTLVVSLILAESAFAESVLNFARTTVDDSLNAGFSVMNPSSNYVDVQFTLYGFDGNPVATGLVNPVSYRIAPRGQFSMLASEIFATSLADGWVQVTSPVSGLIGTFFSGDFSTQLEGINALPAYATQVIPIVREDQVYRSEIQILNPGAGSGNVTITFFGASGEELGTTIRSLTPHAALRLAASSIVPNATGSFSVRISSSVPVASVASVRRGDSVMFASGQPVDQPASARIGSNFVSGNGFHSTLILANPNTSPAVVTIRLFSETGGVVHPALTGLPPRSFTVPARGSVSLDELTLSGLPFAPSVNGWLRIESGNIALNGLMVLDQGQSLTTFPLETVAHTRTIYTQISENDSLFTGLALANASIATGRIDLALVRPDGTTLVRKSIDLSGNAKFSSLVRDIFPESRGRTGDYLFLTSTVPLYGVEVLGALNGRFLAGVGPDVISDSFRPAVAPSIPVISEIIPGTDVRPGMRLRVSATNLSGDGTFLLGDVVVSANRAAPVVAVYTLDVPAVEPGFVSLRVRGANGESEPVMLRVLAPDDTPTHTLLGEAFYQKIPVSDNGLDVNHSVMVPIRSARVEVVDRSLQAIIAVSETDANGHFRVPVPFEPDLTVRVVSRLRSGDLRVADNTSANALYSITGDLDARQASPKLTLADNSRLSGAFNILEMIQRSNDAVRTADLSVTPPPISIFWSTRNTSRSGNVSQGLVGTTYFNYTNSTAFVLGDRNIDSDEYDDSVIVHEYGHMLAARFSRDDSPGAAHGVGDMLDPRVAWSEGWANFFSSAVRNDQFFRDSMGPNGVEILKYDLEDNVPPADKPGYWSEASVDSMLWDLYDDHNDTADDVQFPLSVIWSAFADLRNERFVYFPYFLERFIARAPESAGSLQAMARLRSIDFQPNVRPSVSNPFPRPINVGDTVTGEVDSLTSRRTNLIQSSHFLSFTTTGGAAAIRLDINGLGPGDNPNANDLDLFLMDRNGRLIGRSDRGLNGQSELISMTLPAGSYFIEIRSYYTKVETNTIVFNSGRYRLNVLIQ